jgi:hypothetical protein
MKILLNKKYKFIIKKGIMGYGSLNKDLKTFLKGLTLEDKNKYIIKIFTDATPNDEDYEFDFIDVDTYAPLYYEELSSFDGTNHTLIDSKIGDIINEMGETLERLN